MAPASHEGRALTEPESPGRTTGLRARRLRPEIMDRPDLDAGPHRRALDGLARLNGVSRAAAGLWAGVSDVLAVDPGREFHVLDIASGAGDVSRGLWRLAKRRGRQLRVHGFDVSPTAVEHARARTPDAEAVTFGVADALTDGLPAGFDVIVCSLFLHHLTEDEAITLLRKMGEAASLGVVVSDLRRSRFGYALAVAATRALTGSDIVWHDGPRSVEGAFTTAEFKGLAERAGLGGVKVRNAWPQRFVATWRKPQA